MLLKRKIWTGIAASAAMMLLIFDAKTALSGAQAGLALCIRTVIPSLLPFIVISIVINSNLTGYRLPFLQLIGKQCGVPSGAESLLFLGILGGYPIGAQGISEAYKNKLICKQDAQRLLGFCNNAGPAFIFGMLGNLFENKLIAWILWGTHILSAILVGCILPKGNIANCKLRTQSTLNYTQALEKSLRTMAVICAWVILFRIVIAFSQRWFLWLLPEQLQIWIISFTELSNGCCELFRVTAQGARFVISAGALAFGGICVTMQTMAVTGTLGLGMYFPGKVLQTCISILTAIALQPFLFSKQEQHPVTILFILALIAIACLITAFLRRQKRV